MKTIEISALAAVLIAASACNPDKFLDQKPFNTVSPENFYSTEEQMNMALISCYETINTHKIPGITYCQYGSYGQGLLYIMNAPSDDVVAPQGSFNEGLEMEWGNFTENSRVVRQFWKVFYAGVNRCNTILNYIDGIEDLPAETRTLYKAEARFMRAFFMYHLAWNFGGIPIVDNYASDGMEPRSSLEKVYAFILDDLDFASQNCSDTGIVPNVSANRFTACAYLGRICNYLAACKRSGIGADLVAAQPLNDFSWVDADAMSQKAKLALQTVVTESPYILVDEYHRLFRETTKGDQHKECLFLAELALSGSEGYWPNSFYIHTPASGGSVTPTAWGGRHVPTPRAFFMYDHRDPRRDYNLTGTYSSGYEVEVIDDVKYARPNGPQATVDSAYVDKETGEWVTYHDPVTGAKATMVHPIFDSPIQTYNPTSGIAVCPGKVRLAIVGELQHTNSQHAFSYPLMRLADVYLMYAEALYFADGDEAGAREWMDKVLMRACQGDETLFAALKESYKRDDFVDELLESRERELIFEFSRKWDLIRFNRIDAAINSLNSTIVEEKLGELDEKFLHIQASGYLGVGIPNLKDNWFHHKIWLPISDEQIGVNPNLTQNANW